MITVSYSKGVSKSSGKLGCLGRLSQYRIVKEFLGDIKEDTTKMNIVYRKKNLDHLSFAKYFLLYQEN